MTARFSIGIDLGTTNCAVAFEPLEGDTPRTEVLTIPQWERPGVQGEWNTLPSFLYLPTDHEAEAYGGGPAWIPGRLARRQSAETPGRVVHSAKSWLCHHALDRTAPFLPWDSDSLDRHEHISPVQASSLLLEYLRGAWDSRFADQGARFTEQEVTITVPASFDPVAQGLTLDAARQAGFPDTVRLIEEPQAAFYRWLEQHTGGLAAVLPREGAGPRHVAVIDIGGGTSDFSLFEVRHREGSAEPHIRRIAVSDHLLLGGDNIDLALAHAAQQRLPEGTELAPTQWNFLVAQCREAKERCLSGEGAGDEFTLSVPGRGSGLFSGTLSTSLRREEVESILLDGFFPECPADAEPADAPAGLREWALPYASDSAVTRYLAGFLRDRPPVDAVLFNGGSLQPAGLRSRLRQLIGGWQGGHLPVELENPEPDLAVARGAARFRAIRHRRSELIESSAARGVYLELYTEAASRELVCILPHGAKAGEEFEVKQPDLALTLGHHVQFQLYHSTRHAKDHAGDLVIWDHRSFQPLPPLQTIAKLAGSAAGQRIGTVPVHLSACLNELGLLRVVCISNDPRVDQSWPLEFNLRPHEDAPTATVDAPPTDPGVDPSALEAAVERIGEWFRGPPPRKEKPTANKLLRHLESILDLPKHDWNGTLIRSLWSALSTCSDCRGRSPDHEEAWLILAGCLLRPGFGAEGDAARIDDLWRACAEGPAHPGKRIALQEFILWRRVAGGLSRERQEAILTPLLPKLRGMKAPAELVRLAGSLERIDEPTKVELAREFTARAVELADGRKYAAPWFVALGLLLNRAPLYAGPSAVVPSDEVAASYDACRHLDWSLPEFAELQSTFLRAARVVDDPAIDLPASLRDEIADRLCKAGTPAVKAEKIRGFVAVESSDQAGLFGESLPPGLSLGGAS